MTTTITNIQEVDHARCIRAAASRAVSFIEMLEQSHGYDDDLESLLSSNGDERNIENDKDLVFLNSSGYYKRKKDKRSRKKNKKRNKKKLSHQLSSFDMPDIEYSGESIEVPCFAKLVVSFDAPIIAPANNPNFLEIQTAWIETPDRPLRKIKVTSEALSYAPSNVIDTGIYSGSSSSDSSNEDNEKNDDSDNGSSGSDMMSLHSDVSSDDFNNDALDVEKLLQLDKLD
eukprot:g8808.t1